MNNRENGKSNSVGGGIGFTSALQLAFIVLKLCGVIEWSWLWVLSPTWISIILVVVVTVVVMKLLK